jgi:hypothetical protein
MANSEDSMIKTLIASLILILIGVAVAAAAGPEIIVAHRGFGSPAEVKYGVSEHSLAAYGLAIEKAGQNIYVDLICSTAQTATWWTCTTRPWIAPPTAPDGL